MVEFVLDWGHAYMQVSRCKILPSQACLFVDTCPGLRQHLSSWLKTLKSTGGGNSSPRKSPAGVLPLKEVTVGSYVCVIHAFVI